MTRTEERLTDALTATADAVREDTLRSLVAPVSQPRRAARFAPVAAVAAVLFVIGLAVAGQFYETDPGDPPAAATVPRYYVVISGQHLTVAVRSTATGAVTATVPYPRAITYADERPMVAAAGDGMFFLAAFAGRAKQESIYRFQVTSAGKVRGFTQVPGLMPGAAPGALSPEVDAMAASPNGSQLAVSVGPPSAGSPLAADRIFVINTSTGARTEWAGGTRPGKPAFSAANLSWTGNGRELVVLGQWCGGTGPLDNESCSGFHLPVPRTAEVWALNPASGGGLLSSGRLLLRQSAKYPYIAQAIISPDGSTITAVTLRGPVPGPGHRYLAPGNVAVEQISVATGKRQRVLYRRHLVTTNASGPGPGFLPLSQDSSGRHWTLNVTGDSQSRFTPGRPVVRIHQEPVNGWISDGKLIPLKPTNEGILSEAW